MSLIATATPWIDTGSKKRVSTLRKTIKKKPSNNEDNIETIQNISNERNNRVNELLNEMNIADNNESSYLADFTPIDPPIIQAKQNMENVEYSKEYNPAISNYLDASLSHKNPPQTNYMANNIQHEKLSDYSTSYNPPSSSKQPYYANMGLSNNSNDKLMERINYMIHLLEAQEQVKTDNITEEFILYTFLGVFVIFVVDSFTKAGKYTR